MFCTGFCQDAVDSVVNMIHLTLTEVGVHFYEHMLPEGASPTRSTIPFSPASADLLMFMYAIDFV